MSEISYPDFGPLGLRVLGERLALIEKRAEGRLMAPHELAEKRVLERSIAELEAAGRARARCPKGRMDPIDVVRLQMDELDKAGLTYDCLNVDDIIEIHRRDSL